MIVRRLGTIDGRTVAFGLVPFGNVVAKEPGLYAVYGGNRLIYIGKADDLDERIGSGAHRHEKAMAFAIFGATEVAYASISNALLRDELEADLIKANPTPLNHQHNALAFAAFGAGPRTILGDLFR